MKYLVVICVAYCIINPEVLAQEMFHDLSSYRLKVKKSLQPIVIDGILDEHSWSEADFTESFWQQFPKDNIKADARTEVRLTYDSTYLYISAKCFDVSKYVVQTLKRDNGFFDNDAFTVIIDPVNSNTNGFLFSVSPYNVQTEEVLGPNAPPQNRMNFSWDNRWFSAVTRHKEYYLVEIALPFKTLRFKGGNTTWGINFLRNDMARNQKYSWTPLPVNFEPYDLGYTGSLEWDASPKKTGTNISLLPYITTGAFRDNESETPETETSLQAGVDAKIAVTSSLNLDITVNPDFSQVDVDVQQTNLTRFNLRYPERRPFFLENSDLFAEVGPNDAKPIFTRRMGLDADNRPVPINFGVRLSGNVNANTRIGLLHLQTQARNSTPGQNYSIAVFNQRIWTRSILRGYLTNRQSYTKEEGWNANDYGRNAGMEFNYLNSSGTWNVFAAYHLSQKSNIGMGSYVNLGVEHSGRNWKYRVNYWDITTDYYADIGFIPRLDNYDALLDTTIHLGWKRLYWRFGYVFRPRDKRVVAHDLELRNYNDFYPDGTISDAEVRFVYEMRFRNTGRFSVQPQYFKTNLRFFTDFTDGAPLIPGPYEYSRVTVSYNSDSRKLFSFTSELGVGQYYNGDLTKYVLQVNYRKQPWGTFSLAWEENQLRLPDPYGSSDIQLINVRVEVNFSTKVFWTTFLQYNTQRDNFNINSRLQWRYASMSDLFLVYTDNYITSPFMQGNKNRAIQLKINYMFNL